MICNKKTKLCSHLVTKQSFHHNLNYTFNQKTSLTNVVTLDILIDDMKRNDKNIQSFGHKTVIWSQSKLHIKSKNFFSQSCYI